VSHDISTPLTIINHIADLILRVARSPMQESVVQELVQRLRRNTRSLTDLSSALVDISSLDAGRIPVFNTAFSLNELLEDERDRLLPLAQAKGLELVIEAPCPLVVLETDRVKLARVLSNLVGNAIKFTNTGAVTISGRTAPGQPLVIEVRDSGPGIAPDKLETIFEEYGQLGNKQRDSAKGWGLGLAICRRLLQVMGGTLTVRSELRVGTVFTVRLPASCLASPAGAEHNPRSSPERGEPVGSESG
jgi:signal transduction histidine kinase